MATRSIVTSHPDVECDVCGRRLLRGERPNVFLAGADRRTVCELCAPRAADVGWMREGDADHQLADRPLRALRGRGLLWRLRQRREAGTGSPVEGLASDGRDGRRLDLDPYPLGAELAGHPQDERQPLSEALELDGRAGRLRESSYDFLGPLHPLEGEARAHSRQAQGHAAESEGAHQPLAASAEGHAGPAGESAPQQLGSEDLDGYVAQALKAFNAGEHPKRVAGIARALGAPCVSVRPTGPTGALVQITVAWDICWYRYLVDAADPAAAARLADEGMELEELPAEDRVANVAAGERGELQPL